MSSMDRTWIQKRSTLEVDEKHLLARYAAWHLVSHGQVLFLGTGSTLCALMREVIGRQVQDVALDLLVVTSNLQIVGMGRASDKQEQDADGDQEEASFWQACKATQIVLTGGISKRVPR